MFRFKPFKHNDDHQLALLALFLVSFIAFFVVIAHMACVFIGVECYKAQGAPPIIVESAVAGTLTAPLLTTLVSLMFLIAGVYTLSAAKVIRQLPFLQFIIYSIVIVCLLRGLALIPFYILNPELINNFDTVTSIIWFVSGVFLFYGYTKLKNRGSNV